MNTATANKLITCNSIPKDAVTILHTILIEIVAIIVIVDVDLHERERELMVILFPRPLGDGKTDVSLDIFTVTDHFIVGQMGHLGL